MFKRISTRFAVRFAPIVAVFALIFAPVSAQASATGCAGGNPSWGPTTYCVTLDGTGTYVRTVTGTWRGSGFACDSYITAEFFDVYWNWYQTKRSATQWGCATGSSAAIGIWSNKWPGYMCSTLHYHLPGSTTDRRMSVCHSIR